MPLSRRDFLARASLALAAGAAAGCARIDGEDGLRVRDGAAVAPDPAPLPRPGLLRNDDGWGAVRDEFALSDDWIHMSAMYVSSHPRTVRDAIAMHRDALDRDPVAYLNQNNRARVEAVRAAAARYLGVDRPADIALTDSTTMGIGLVYNGLRLRPGSEFLSTTSDYYVTHEALRLASLRGNHTVRQVPLYDSAEQATAGSLVHALVSAIRPQTRVLALTWVHSGTGLKLPVRHIAEGVAQLNAGRDERDRILVCVDGVHGFGVENVTMGELGCDFFVAGCHKWLFGPRGTGLLWGSPEGWEHALAIVPSFHDDDPREAWITDTEVDTSTSGLRMTPGGFKPFEHQWALTEAFALHERIGRAAVQARTHALARQLKEGLRGMEHVALRTPMSHTLSAGIVCFDVDGMSPFTAVERLRQRRIVATVTPYAARHVRLSPSIRNSPAEVDAVLRAVRELA